uniref:Uncharacterized protein n=1 Tax=Candidatus Kentrum sp. DK TaxID=2126562 RepID=A0A450S6C6_9GAMM|nr:MAG: hypothetical protein BECKDK2373C_GA0170839_101825 [Candidatus Kentron sp. DK]
MLGIIILVSSGIFLTQLEGRAFSYRSQQNQRTTEALLAAKQALIGWAAGHPDAPGLLPWTDRNGDGNYDGDSDCASLSASANFNPAFLLGRLPWRGRTNPCEKTHGGLGIDVRDGAGERLWYAVSRNLVRRYQSPARYPIINPALANHAPFPWLVVRDVDNTLRSDRVAAVILAPGTIREGQNRSGAAPSAHQYLERHGPTGIDNADADGCPDSHPGCGGGKAEEFVQPKNNEALGGGAFNDRLVFITIDELMDAVERRALNEARKALEDYRDAHGVYPWMSPVAYPATVLSGNVTENGITGRELIDRRAGFLTAGIRPGQLVRNTTDGSWGVVGNVTGETMLALTTEGLRGGVENRFDINRISNPGDNDGYEILRDASGLATGASAGNTLRDNNRSTGFDALGIRLGDLVENVGDGLHGVVTALPAPDTMTLKRLGADSSPGETMDFDPGESYRIPRFNGIPGTWAGRLPLHAMDEPFRTGFTVAWDIPEAIPDKDTLADNTGYLMALEAAIQRASEGSASAPPREVPWENGTCIWKGIAAVHCRGETAWRWHLAGTITGTGPGTLQFRDEDTDFQGFGVETGDIVLNETDGSRGIIRAVTEDGIEAFSLQAGSNNRFETGNRYRVRVATRILSGASADCATVPNGAGSIACGPGTLVDVGSDFAGRGVRVGDTIENRSRGWWGIIEAVGAAGPYPNTQDTLRVALPPSPGTATGNFAQGDAYTIRSGFVDKRRYRFSLAFTGTASSQGGMRRVTTGPLAALPPGNRVRIQDWDEENARIVLDTAITTAPATLGKIHVSGIQLDLAPDFPPWFLANHWHHFLHGAVARPYLPGGSGACSPGVECLTVTTRKPGGVTTQDSIAALLISAGRATDGDGCQQVRPASDPAQYLEGSNALPFSGGAGSIFEGRHPRRMDPCFRDTLRVVSLSGQ